MFHNGSGTADHQAEAAIDPPDTAGGAAIDVLNAFAGERPGASDVVLVEGVAAINDDVSL